jgi:hypothetical protein
MWFVLGELESRNDTRVESRCAWWGIYRAYKHKTLYTS